MAVSQLPRAPRTWLPTPKTFLGLMSLQTGTEVITLISLLNNITGIYGLLAILTGYHLTAFQLSQYVYSVVVLANLAYIFPHIRRQTPFWNVALAWLYTLDTLMSTVTTIVFGLGWYSAIHPATSERDGVTVADPMAADIALSGSLIIAFRIIRIYFCLVVLSHARQVLHRSMRRTLSNEVHKGEGLRFQPFAVGISDGEGWQGKLGRLMTSIGKGYWAGGREQLRWALEEDEDRPLTTNMETGEINNKSEP